MRACGSALECIVAHHRLPIREDAVRIVMRLPYRATPPHHEDRASSAGSSQKLTQLVSAGRQVVIDPTQDRVQDADIIA